MLSILTMIGSSALLIGQDTEASWLSGSVMYYDVGQGEAIPLIGANVYWIGPNVGVVTDVDGSFQIEDMAQSEAQYLVVSYVGFVSDTIEVAEIQRGNRLDVMLKSETTLDEVRVTYRQRSTEVSSIDPIKVENISEKEILKAACCNLSESFETIPSVDVSFTDAVTGTRQIQMLGLSGPYIQITRENMPEIRGLSAVYGLTFVPGAWIEGIHLSKGAGSVVNGFESIAGQINTELWKPESADRMYLNLYANEGGRLEANANFAHRFKDERWSTGLLLHTKYNSNEVDRNNDSFTDNLLTEHFIGINRWKFRNDNRGIEGQFGIKGTIIDNDGGQIDGASSGEETLPTWTLEQKIRRLDGWLKVGKIYPKLPWKSIALQLSASVHDEESRFGLRDYDAKQTSFYANFIYQGILSNVRHKFRAGLSFQYDDFDESLQEANFLREEIVPGGYFEYTFLPNDDFTLVLGLRGDHHNNYGFFATPRAHLRYALTESTVLRASGGRGQRTASIISENIGLLASSRTFHILSENGTDPYGLDAEVAWNYGVNVTQEFKLWLRDARIGIDLYRTSFENQIVVDLDASPQSVSFYNLDGDSYSNSMQVQLDYELMPRFDLRLAYRWLDVRTTYDGELLEKPLVSGHRAFANLAYETNNRWKFDWTINWQGQKRIPSTNSNPEEYRLEDESPDFVVMNVQVTKVWRKNFEVYVGAENLLDYSQDAPILASELPYSPYFDSSLVWGPVFGRNVYMGLRYRID